jgi:hypothetical protein
VCMQGLLCGVLQVIVQKLSETDATKPGVLQYGDAIMEVHPAWQIIGPENSQLMLSTLSASVHNTLHSSSQAALCDECKRD